MSSALDAQLGIVLESTYGTPVTVTRFYDFNSESMKSQFGRINSTGIRTGLRAQRSTAFTPYVIGAAGSIAMDVPTKNWGYWLRLILGATATGSVTDANYTHTGTFGDLTGDMFTMQIGRPFMGSATVQPFTYHGCKVAKWTLGCSKEQLLVFSADIDAEDVDTSTGLATASYVAGYDQFSFAGGSVTIGGAAVELESFEVSVDNNLKTDRRYIRGSALKKEPLENGFRNITWKARADFDALTQYNRYASTTAAGAISQIIATFDGPVAHGGTTLPRVEITIDAPRFDDASFNISSPNLLMQDLSGIGMYDLTDSPVTVTYRTTDTTA